MDAAHLSRQHKILLCIVNGHHKAIKKPREVNNGNSISEVTVHLDIKKMVDYFYLDEWTICMYAMLV